MITFDTFIEALTYALSIIGGTGAIYYSGKVKKWFLRKNKEHKC